MKTYSFRRSSDRPSNVPGSIRDSLLESRLLQGMSQDGNLSSQILSFSSTKQLITVKPLLSDHLLRGHPIFTISAINCCGFFQFEVAYYSFDGL